MRRILACPTLAAAAFGGVAQHAGRHESAGGYAGTQKREIKALPAEQTAGMKASARQPGRQVIAAEAELDAAFKSNVADDRAIAESTARIASLQGRLRAVHLLAHLQTRRLLSGDQVTAYNTARGYGPDAGAHKHRQ